ncbi:unnamed protein product [Dovyalis caffra]|uniref:Phosphatidylinositol N-acetylglucosaminyltransferase subunit H conserved domain-containing protein n=1 Tax=Dovyalis caffra TaxID=77055 RepID=A0AAV1SLY6_9ROSI|nr:unnamed protein product [Dovyalis caffra]
MYCYCNHPWLESAPSLTKLFTQTENATFKIDDSVVKAGENMQIQTAPAVLPSSDIKEIGKAIDMHCVVVRKSNAKGFFLFLSAAIVLANASYLVLLKDLGEIELQCGAFPQIAFTCALVLYCIICDKSINILLWSFLLSVFLVKLLIWKRVMKESVVVMPTFGVQLETHYVSGRIVRRFVPIGKILKPVLLECVTPVTCYWSLSLLLRGEAELMLVFKELRPPVKMLIPIWKALCGASGIKEGSDS